MNRIRLFIYLFLFTLVLGTCLYVSFGKESKIPDFPVPFFANYINDDNPKDLKYSSSGFLYWLTLRVNGWKENDHAGELKVFEKNNREVLVFQPPGEKAIYLSENFK